MDNPFLIKTNQTKTSLCLSRSRYSSRIKFIEKTGQHTRILHPWLIREGQGWRYFACQQ